VLLVEIGADHCCYAILDDEKRKVLQVTYFAFEEFEDDQAIARMLEYLPEREWKKVVIASSYLEALLIPSRFAGSATALLDLVYDMPGQERFTDEIEGWQMQTAFGVPATVLAPLKDVFPEASVRHMYSSSVRAGTDYSQTPLIDINFSPRLFRVILKKDNKVHLAESYAYKTPYDVVYYLLKICSEFGWMQEDTHLMLSGLIEQDSALFQQLHQYFLHISFASEHSCEFPESAYPTYYFQSLSKLAECELSVEA
jgi:hypothetical protein